VTFTNKAAAEMRERVAKLLSPEVARGLHWLGTFHAMGAKMLRAMSEHIQRRPDFSIYDEHDQLTVMKHVVDEMGIDKKWYKPNKLVEQLTKAKERGFLPADIPEIDEDSRVFARVYARYETWLEAANALDFEDLLLVPMLLAERRSELGERIRSRFDHVLVDEFQDTSHTQYKLVRALAGTKQNLTVVGDDDQCHPGDTLIRVVSMSHVEEVPIAELHKFRELRVLSWNQHNKQWRVRPARVAARDYRGEMLSIRVRRAGSWNEPAGVCLLRATPEHRFVRFKKMGELEECAASELVVRDQVPVPFEVVCEGDFETKLTPCRDGYPVGATQLTWKWAPIDAIEKEDYSGQVYSLDVEKDHTYVANGVVVHNCIYEWRSADVKLIRNFKKDFPSATVVKLEENYRSTGHIVRAALEVIQKSPFRVAKALWTGAEPGAKIRMVQCPSDRHEGRWIAGELQRFQEVGGNLSDAAILYRTHQVARAIEEPLRDRGIPYVVLGGPRFYDRREVRDVLAYFRLAANASSNVDFIRAIGSPPRGIGSAKVLRLAEFARSESTSLFKAIPRLLASGELRPKEHGALEEFHELLRAAHAMRATKQSPLAICRRLIESSGYEKMWRDAAAEANRLGEAADYDDACKRADNVVEILSAVGSFEEGEKAEGRQPSLESYLERVALMTEPNTPGAGKVTLMTIHASKGLEFSRVFVAGCEDGTLPLGDSVHDPASLDEERRLAYVAVTRARHELALTYADQRFVRGKVEYMRPSRLFDAISDEIVDAESGG
jgi:superfamily I DNA/RNA helicase